MTIIQADAEAQRLSLEMDFEDVVRVYQRRIYRILYLLARDRDEADSLTQECFLRAYASQTARHRHHSLSARMMMYHKQLMFSKPTFVQKCTLFDDR